jgi:hypothetical protein
VHEQAGEHKAFWDSSWKLGHPYSSVNEISHTGQGQNQRMGKIDPCTICMWGIAEWPSDQCEYTEDEELELPLQILQRKTGFGAVFSLALKLKIC